jgi:hypothetical protein
VSDEDQISKLRSKGLTTNDKNKLRKIIGKLGKLGKGPCSPLATEAILSIISAHSDQGVKKFALDTLKLMIEGKL